MGPWLLQRDLDHGPLVLRWFVMLLEWFDEDSESGTHARGPADLLWKQINLNDYQYRCSGYLQRASSVGIG